MCTCALRIFGLYGACGALMECGVCVYVLPGRCLSLSELELIY